MKKIIISGNKNYGLGTSFYKVFPDADFFSRTNGEWDFQDAEQIKKFADKSLDYDVYISCSYVPYFKQLLLLASVVKRWYDNKKRGQIIVIGSTADWSTKVWLYPTEKKALRDYCRRYGSMAAGGGPDLYPGSGIRITYVAPGMIDLPKQREKHGERLAKLDPDYIVGVCKWLLDQPENINIYDISMEPVQYEVSKSE